MLRHNLLLPVARPVSEFLLETLADEVLVYDQVTHKAHCLTPAAALVWSLCDRAPTPTRDAARAALLAAGHRDALDEVLRQLSGAGLVSAPRQARTSQSRRRMLKKTAVAAGVILASPVIYSIVAPSVAEAASNVACGKNTQPCCPTGIACNFPLTCAKKTGLCH